MKFSSILAGAFCLAQLSATSPVRADQNITNSLSDSECADLSKGMFMRTPLIGWIDSSGGYPRVTAQGVQAVNIQKNSICYFYSVDPNVADQVDKITPDRTCYDGTSENADTFGFTVVQHNKDGSTVELVTITAEMAKSKLESAQRDYNQACPTIRADMQRTPKFAFNIQPLL